MNSRKDKSNALIGELESIRALLNEDEQHANVPLLIPDSSQLAADRIPVLSVIAADVQKPQHATLPESTRAAAAQLAVQTTRRDSQTPQTREIPASSTSAGKEPAPGKISNTPHHDVPVTLPAVVTSSASQREKLVDDIVRSALPRLEALLRELVQEALLQDKLRGGKR